MKINYLDKFGMISSAACAVHCFAVPIVITFLPYLGLSFLADETFEIIMLLLSTVLGISSLCLGFKTHKNKKMLFLFSLGICMLFLGHYVHDKYEGPQSILILVLGGLALIVSHYINNKLCQKCNSCSGD